MTIQSHHSLSQVSQDGLHPCQRATLCPSHSVVKARYKGLLSLRFKYLKAKSLVLLSYSKRENGKNLQAKVRKKVKASTESCGCQQKAKEFGKEGFVQIRSPNDSCVQIPGGHGSKRQSSKVMSLSSP